MSTSNNLTDVVRLFISYARLAIPILVGLALFAFFKGLIAFIAKSGDESSHAEGRSLMIWGIIALFIMISFAGIIMFFQRDLGFPQTFPRLPVNGK